MTTTQLFDAYLSTFTSGTIESNSLSTLRIHLRQFSNSLGERYRIQRLTLLDLQKHEEKRHKNGIAPATIKKEITTLRSCWNWAANGGSLKGPFPGKGLRLPKEIEKEPYRSFAEIQSRVSGCPKDDQKLWNSLYLTRDEIEDFLKYVKDHARQPWLFPMVAFAAFTGARRSELLRMLASDVDLAGETVTVREKKRVRGKGTTRTVPMPKKLKVIVSTWIATRPESPWLFCQELKVARSKTRRDAPTPITCNEAHDHLKRTLGGSQWSVVKGWHVLRHSFISALASNGVDQRVIDELVGHQSEEQRLRYRHLYPEVMKEAIGRVFG